MMMKIIFDGDDDTALVDDNDDDTKSYEMTNTLPVLMMPACHI